LLHSDLWINEYSPEQFCWEGAPYYYGGVSWQDDCQTQINQGFGLGASKCHYEHNSNLTKTWTAGVNCAFFISKCFVDIYYNVANLKIQCTELYPYDQENKADITLLLLRHNESVFINYMRPEKGLPFKKANEYVSQLLQYIPCKSGCNCWSQRDNIEEFDY
jgi:hypothetical protein